MTNGGKSRITAHSAGLAIILLVGTMLCSGCLLDWNQFGGSATGTHASVDTGLTTASIPTLSPSFTGTTGGAIYSTPVVSSGVAYATSDDGRLDAFDATGATNCAGVPNTCTPLWTASIEPAGAIAGSGSAISSTPAVVDGSVFVGSTDGKLYAFDAAGITGCSGSPKTCSPKWTASTGSAIYGSPTVQDDVLYVGSTDGKLYAFDAKGVTNCSASVCSPLWTASTGTAIDDTPAVRDGVVYIGSTNGKLYAYDAAGVTNCSASVCSPLWTAATGGSITFSSPSVDGGVALVGATDGKLYAYDATGTTGCSGSPKTCAPLWTMATGGSIVSTAAIWNKVGFVGSSDHKLYAVDATGTTGCSGSPKTCSPLWTATTGAAIRSTPAVEGLGSMVFVGSDDHSLYAFDSNGVTHCSGSPKTCTSLWTTSTGGAVASSPIVAQGTVFFGSLDHSIYADTPWVAPHTSCPANPHSGMSPCQLAAAYRLPSTVAGAGRTVAIVDAFDDPNAESDLAVYRAAYGLPPCTTANGCFTKLNQSGVAGSYPAGDPGWAEEISLDVDTVSAICPLCHITLVEANTNATSNLLAAELIAGGLSPTAISNSWGSSEFTGEHSLDGNFTFPGIPVTVSTGDSGYGTSWPASAPNVTAVGGTVLTADSSARGWSESVWSGANSGCSTKEAKPAWQTDSGCAKRTIADVSALAGLPGEAIYDTYGGDPGWEDFGGTSLASPIIASVYALAYPDAAMSSTYANHASLFDVTSGSNGSCGGSYLCTGVAGYDGPSGLGTPCGTANFGTGPYVTPGCSTLAPTPSAKPLTSKPASNPNLVFTPACTSAPAGYARCDAQRITKS